MPVENIYQMFTRLGAAGFFVKRDSWSHPRTVAQVISVGGLTSGPLPGPPPYHHPSGSKPLIVMAAVSYQGTAAKIEVLASPGTFAYRWLERPDWWVE